MTVYVDDAVWPWRGAKWARMTADEPKELHAAARRLGLGKTMYRTEGLHHFYSLSPQNRARAVRNGAVALTVAEYSAVYRTLPIAAELRELEARAVELRADLALYGEEWALSEVALLT